MERVLLGDDFVNFLFLGSLFLLVSARMILIPNEKSMFRFSFLDVENENFSLYSLICGLVYNILVPLMLLPFFHRDFAFYNTVWIRYLVLFAAVFAYQIFTYTAGNVFLQILAEKDTTNNYRQRYTFLFIKLVTAVFLCFIIYYTPIKGHFLFYIVIVSTCLLWVCEWIWLMFFIKQSIKIPNYYEILYLCTFEILPALCLLKLVFFE
ncbi:MAG: DUF4271 domain-containing protein [Flavobacteriaceae bacterium]|nr:DUF4271 domain-containing protein [Flavobacteriaceae bacterium]